MQKFSHQDTKSQKWIMSIKFLNFSLRFISDGINGILGQPQIMPTFCWRIMHLNSCCCFFGCESDIKSIGYHNYSIFNLQSSIYYA
jgi:hypothetical protein